MTYCLAIKINDGLVFASDSRTHAGVDQLSIHSKMFTFATEGERVFIILTAGNLATTQAVIAQIRRDIKNNAPVNLHSVADLGEAAEYLGDLSVSRQKKHGNVASAGSVDTSASLILGGQIGESKAKVFMIYPEGNYISATSQHPYQQIGEVKYGKPILDRIITPETNLEEAALCALVSVDSTMRSNATVGPPIEALIYERDSLRLDRHVVFAADDPYLTELRTAWEHKVKEAFSELPRFNWEVPTRKVVHE